MRNLLLEGALSAESLGGRGVIGGYRGKSRQRREARLRRNSRLPDTIAAALKHGDRKRKAMYAAMWVCGLGGKAGATAAEKVLARASVTVGGLEVACGVEVRVSLARWGGRELVHLRTWFKGRDGRWRPTRRGVTVSPSQLAALEGLVRQAHQAYGTRRASWARGPRLSVR